MPFRPRYGKRKIYRKKRFYKKRPFRKAQLGVSKSLRPAIHRFKRSISQDMTLDAAFPPTGWVADGNIGLMTQQVFTLADLNDETDFTNLFISYRLKGVRLQGWLSNTQSEASSNQNIIMYYNQNWQGVSQVSTLTEQFFLDRPASVHKTLMNHTNNKPSFDIYIKLRQLSNTWSGSHVSNDYGTMKPRWISCAESTTPHYGLNMRLARVNNSSFGLAAGDFQSIKIIKTYYLELRGVS